MSKTFIALAILLSNCVPFCLPFLIFFFYTLPYFILRFSLRTSDAKLRSHLLLCLGAGSRKEHH